MGCSLDSQLEHSVEVAYLASLDLDARDWENHAGAVGEIVGNGWTRYLFTADVSTEGADRKFSVLGCFQRIPYISVSSSPIHIKTK
jgi:hypothetical protein